MIDRRIEVRVDGVGYLVSKEWAAILRAALDQFGEVDTNLRAKVSLTGIGPKLIFVIKEVRALTGLNLKEAKSLCDKVRHGNEKVILGTFPWEDIPKIRRRFEEVGATLSIPGALEMLAREAR